jgi:riboflavin biosynthesis pyrimidine reductase
VILVGAGTVRAENYRPIRPDPERAGSRMARGQTSAPRLVIVSGRLDFDTEARVFSDPDHRPTILTSEGADPDRVRSLSVVADVVALAALDGASIVGALTGERLVLCEGGPTLNGALVSAGMVDEINWTVTPMLVSGSPRPMISGGAMSPPVELVLDRTWQGERSMFLRYLRHT